MRPSIDARWAPVHTVRGSIIGGLKEDIHVLEYHITHFIIVVFGSLLIFYLSKKNLVYPTVFSVMFLFLMSSFYQ